MNKVVMFSSICALVLGLFWQSSAMHKIAEEKPENFSIPTTEIQNQELDKTPVSKDTMLERGTKWGTKYLNEGPFRIESILKVLSVTCRWDNNERSEAFVPGNLTTENLTKLKELKEFLTSNHLDINLSSEHEDSDSSSEQANKDIDTNSDEPGETCVDLRQKDAHVDFKVKYENGKESEMINETVLSISNFRKSGGGYLLDITGFLDGIINGKLGLLELENVDKSNKSGVGLAAFIDSQNAFDF